MGEGDSSNDESEMPQVMPPGYFDRIDRVPPDLVDLLNQCLTRRKNHRDRLKFELCELTDEEVERRIKTCRSNCSPTDDGMKQRQNVAAMYFFSPTVTSSSICTYFICENMPPASFFSCHLFVRNLWYYFLGFNLKSDSDFQLEVATRA